MTVPLVSDPRGWPARWLLLRQRLSPAACALLVSAALAAVWARWTPLVPDLAAQVARAHVARDAGSVAWWTGWFGGLSLPTYSLLSPASMAWLGVRATGGVAVVVGAWATARLVSSAPRPRAAAVAFALAQVADLAAGRVTFVVGLALGVTALLALRGRRGWWLVVLAVATYAASPLAGLFLGIALVGVALTDPTRRRSAAAICVLLLSFGAAMALLFPGTGTMPTSATDLVPPGLCCLGVLLFCRQRTVWVAALLLLAALLGFYAVPGAIGGNVGRLAWVCAAPVAVGYARLPRRPMLVVVVALLALWPVTDLIQQVSSAHDPSTSAQFYAPMLAALHQAEGRAGPLAVGERLELVQPRSRWSVAFVGSGVSLARGWDRQADVAADPIFYRANSLSSDSYHEWLQALAVGWVALPNVALDYASVAEAQLIHRGLGYLRPVWSNSSWKLYRVTDASPLALGAQVTGVTPSTVDVRAAGPQAVLVRVRWSPYLRVWRVGGAQVPPSCVEDDGGWLSVVLPLGGDYRITSRFDPLDRVTPGHGCPATTG